MKKQTIKTGLSNRFSLNLMMVILVLSMIITACSTGNNSGDKTNNSSTATSQSNNAETPSTEPEATSLPMVELVWYYPQPAAQPDLAEIEKAVNAITTEAIQATIKLKPIDFGEYDQKMNTITAAGEKYDIVWTSNWLFDFVQNIHKGVFQPIDSLLNDQGSEFKQLLPDYLWEMVKVNGETYGVPNYQSITGREGYIIPKSYVDKYQLDLESIKTWEDIEPFLAQIKEAEPNISPIAMSRSGMFSYLASSQNIDTIPITDNPPVGFYRNDDNIELINVYGSPEFKHYAETVREWYLKKYINQDAPTLKSTDDLTNVGKAIVSFNHGLNPGSEVSNSKNKFGGNEIVYAPLTGYIITSNPGIATVNAISKTSANPERAMMFLNLLNTNSELFNLITFGIENKHYNKLDEQTVRINTESGYAPNTGWVFGNTFNGYLTEGMAADTFEEIFKAHETAVPTKIVGFKFDSQNVTAEIANVQTVLDEYLPGITTGAVDPSSKLPEFLDRMDKAGLQKIIDESNTQLEAWKKQSK